MAALTTAQEYALVREAIQALTTLDANGQRRDVVGFTVAGMSVSYSSTQLDFLQSRERELAKRIAVKNLRKRVTPDQSY
jgi:hypothetical protein